MGPRFLGPVRWFPGPFGFPVAGSGLFRASLGQFRRLSTAAGLPWVAWAGSADFRPVPGCRAAGRRVCGPFLACRRWFFAWSAAAAFRLLLSWRPVVWILLQFIRIRVRGADPAVRDSGRTVKNRCNGLHARAALLPVVQSQTVAVVSIVVQSQTGDGRSWKRCNNPFRIRFMEKKSNLCIKNGGGRRRGGVPGAGLLMVGPVGAAWEVLACGWAGWADGGADAVGRSGSGQNGKRSRRLRLLTGGLVTAGSVVVSCIGSGVKNQTEWRI